MKIAFLSGADKNAGDFLIVDRARKLLKAMLPSCNLIEFKRNKSLSSRLESVNECDVVVFAGGPGYMPDMYPNRIPLVGNLEDIKPPMFALGMGAYSRSSHLGGYQFSEKSMQLLERIEHDGFGLGCRDNLTVDALRSAGFRDTVMTGCPAWYNLETVSIQTVSKHHDGMHFDHVAISDPALPENIPVACSLVRFVEKELSPKKISFVFHRGWNADSYSSGKVARCQSNLKTWLERRGVECVDISYSDQGFAFYDSCDIHIGFRVHAHIYNLSMRQPSFLIEEDGRGWGLNETLGFPHIGNPLTSKLSSRFHSLSAISGFVSMGSESGRSKQIIRSVEQVVYDEVSSNYSASRSSYGVMLESFNTMVSHISQLSE